MSESKTSVKRLAAKERAIKALELRKEGKGFQEIAHILGYSSVSGAYDAVMGALHDTLQEPADAVRAMELERIDAMLEAQWPAARGGHLRAQEMVLRLMERRAKYLGLDAPQQFEDVTKKVQTEAGRIAAELGLPVEQVLRESGVQAAN